MNKNFMPGVASIAALVVCAVGWMALPMLEDSKRAVESEASVQLERARRLLDQYDAGLTYKSLLIDRLAREGVEADAADLSGDLAEDYQDVHAAIWETYQPVDWRGGRLSKAQASYDNVAGQVRDGLRAHAEMARRNGNLLGDALAAVDQALAVTRGNESAREHAEANRLKGVIHYHQASVDRAGARLYRAEAEHHRRELAALVSAAAEAVLARTLVADSQVDEKLAEVQAAASVTEAALNADRQALSKLNTRIQDMETHLAQVESRRSDAHQSISQLKADGVDFSAADGAELFAIQLEALSQAYRDADRQAKALLHGNYLDAQIDHTGDYLTGRYVAVGSGAVPEVTPGLLHYRDERAVLDARVAGTQRAIEGFSADAARLAGMKEGYETTQRDAVDRLAGIAEAAAEAHAELNRIDAEAFTGEDEALRLLDQSARIAKQASRYADQWISKARDRTQYISPDAKERSAFNLRLRDGWLGAQIAAGEADARLAKAWIHYDRYLAYSRNAELVAGAVQAGVLGEADAEAEHIKAEEAHDAGVEEISQAMSVLERAHAKAGKHWTFTAQAAGTTYLMALFGHPAYVTEAIEGYRKALQGRETEKFTGVYAARLNKLENR